MQKHILQFCQLDSVSCGNNQGLDDYSVAISSGVIKEDMSTMSTIQNINHYSGSTLIYCSGPSKHYD